MIKCTWERFKKWLAVHHPSLLDDLQPPASIPELQALTQRLGVALPGEFMACLEVHNGQAGRAAYLFDRHAFLSIAHVLMHWKTWNDLLEDGDFDDRVAHGATGVQPVWWDPSWIPFATNGGGDYLCIDMRPAAGGTPGQVIEVLHDTPDRRLLAPTFDDWFGRFVDGKLHSH